jgi:hypothetical protein
MQYGLCGEIAGKENDTIAKAQQRFQQAIKQKTESLKQEVKVPANLQTQKTNAEKLMAAFRKNMEEK